MTREDQGTNSQSMNFPATFDEFAKDYGFVDEKEVYTNGAELIPTFRVKQWLEHISTTKSVTPRGTSEPMTKTLGIELRHNPSELVELLEKQYKSGEISPIVISESLITLFRMLGEKNRPQS